jgi:acetyl esterase
MLDQASAGLVRQLSEAGGPPLHELSVSDARAGSVAMLGMLGRGPEMSRVEEHSIPVAGDRIGARVLVPYGELRGVIVYYHGGGWVMGTLDQFDPVCRLLAERAACAVVLVDYRLAPEHRFPTAMDDAWAALCWTRAELPRLGLNPDTPLVVAGDSSGGNLAAVVALRARGDGGPRLAMQVLVYPVTDADLDTASYRDPDNQLLLSRDTMIWYWDHYLPDSAARLAPEASPLQAPDVSGAPPAIVITAEHDVLRDEGEAYAERLRRADVPVVARRFDGQMHGFFTMLGILPGSVAAVDFVADHLARGLDSGAPGTRSAART